MPAICVTKATITGNNMPEHDICGAQHVDRAADANLHVQLGCSCMAPSDELLLPRFYVTVPRCLKGARSLLSGVRQDYT